MFGCWQPEKGKLWYFSDQTCVYVCLLVFFNGIQYMECASHWISAPTWVWLQQIWFWRLGGMRVISRYFALFRKCRVSGNLLPCRHEENVAYCCQKPGCTIYCEVPSCSNRLNDIVCIYGSKWDRIYMLVRVKYDNILAHLDLSSNK